MKLYYAKGACSLAARIVLEELNLPCEYVAIDARTPDRPEALLRLNPLGSVPVLELDNGEGLTEAAVIVQYLADLKPEAGLAPRAGTMERYRLQEKLGFIATEIHRGFGPLWRLTSLTQNEGAREEIRVYSLTQLGRRFELLQGTLSRQDWILPCGFTVADAYLFTVLGWTKPLKVDLAKWPALGAYQERVRARPVVQSALRGEGLIS